VQGGKGHALLEREPLQVAGLHHRIQKLALHAQRDHRQPLQPREGEDVRVGALAVQRVAAVMKHIVVEALLRGAREVLDADGVKAPVGEEVLDHAELNEVVICVPARRADIDHVRLGQLFGHLGELGLTGGADDLALGNVA
jgi:hypothetical protein